MICNLFLKRKFHYSKLFHKLQYLLGYSGIELNFKTIMHMVKCNDLAGDYAEFGVFKGRSLITAYTFAKIFNIDNMHFYGFDSFEGLPPATGTDQELSNAEVGKYKSERETTKRYLIRSGIHKKRLSLIKGFYKDSLRSNHNKNKLAIVHIDCDFYESTIQVLEYIRPLLQVGTMLLFDDWYLFNGNQDRGQQKAFNEFCSKHPQYSFGEIPAHDLRKLFYVSQINDN